ncbi:hypothetical protein BsWGS_00814 [Bradybaena similaris]
MESGRKRSSKISAKNWRSGRFETGVIEEEEYLPQHTYISDDDTDFSINAAGCDAYGKKNRSYRNRTEPIQFDGLFLVSTSAANLYNRRVMRHLYSYYGSTRPYRIKCVFLVGQPRDKVIQANIEREDYQFRDIIQGRFTDHYHNLTYKTIMGYRWAYLYCKNVKLVLKMDDDVFLDVFKFFDYFLPIVSKRKRTVYGYLNHHPQVFREGKYRVAVEEYKEKEYPNFCSGFFVVPTMDVVADLYEVSKTVRFFRLEDVFTYGLVRERMVDVQLVHLDVITYEWHVYRDCVHDYRCKYMAVEAPASELLSCYDQVMEARKLLGLPGGSLS